MGTKWENGADRRLDMESERKWKLGEDIDRHDNLLDGISFDELILTAHCNCREITPEGGRKGIG